MKEIKKVTVTGGAGFIGSNLVDRLIEMGINVSVIDNLSSGKIENINPKSNFFNVDLSDDSNFNTICQIIRGSDIVFHLAAKARVQPSIINPIDFNRHNVNSTLSVLFACHKENVKRVVYSASSSAYGNNDKLPHTEDLNTNPISPYGLQKLIGEQYCKLFSDVYNLETICLRYFNVYGERQLTEGAYCTVIGIFLNQYKNKQNLTITNDGNQRRDFTYVGDVVNANILSAVSDKKFKGDVINIGSGKNYSINEISNVFKSDVDYIGQVLEPFETLACIEKANSVLGWLPSKNVIDWIKESIDKI